MDLIRSIVTRKIEPRNLHKISLLILFTASGVFFINVYRHILVRWDDAYITFRYAQNLAAGRGLIWNIGGPNVEGFTSLIDVILLALGIKAGISPVIWSVVLGVLSVLISIYIVVRILVDQFRFLHPIAAVALGIYLVDDVTSIHVTSGLETQLFVVFLVLMAYQGLSFLKVPQLKHGILFSFFLFTTILTRPEGVLYGSAIFLVLFFFLYKNRENFVYASGLKYLILAGLLFVFLVFVYGIWKLSYFGYLLPNPFYVKSNQLSFDGIKYVGYFILSISILYSPFLAGVIISFLKNKTKPGKLNGVLLYELFLLLAPVGLALCYYLTIIHEVGGAHRFSYPTYLFIVSALAITISLMFRERVIRTSTANILIALSIVYLGIMSIVQTHLQFSPIPVDEFTQYHLTIANALKETKLGPDGKVLCDASGIIPYTSGFTQVDRVGLTDNFLSGRKKVSQKEREDYMWNQNPDVYIGYELPATPGFGNKNDDPVMREEYIQKNLLSRQLSKIEERIFLNDKDLLYYRMTILRDQYYLVGEMIWPGNTVWGLRSFIYVNKSSPNAELLLFELQKIVSIPNKSN